MSNTWVNPSIVAKEAVMQLENSCVMGNLIHRAHEAEFQKNFNGWKPGSSITIKTPVYFRVKTGSQMDVVDLREENITLTLSYRNHIAWEVTAEEMTYSIDRFSERFIQPAMVALGNYIDSTVLGLYKYICNQVGTPGTTPDDYLTYALAAARMDDHAVPQNNRHCVINPTARAYLSDHLKGLNSPAMVQKIIEKAYMGDVAGFNMYMSQNVQNHTVGTWAAGTILVDDTVADGDTNFNLDQNGAGSAYTLKAGDIFTAASSYAVNPISGANLGYLRQFAVTADTVFADAGGGDMNVTPATTPGSDPYNLYSSGAGEKYLAYQNVTTLPQNNDAVTVAGSTGLVHPVNLAFHRDSLALCMVPLAVPASVGWKAQESKNGYSIRVVRDYDVEYDKEYIRFDVLFGVQVLNPFMACRIAG